MTAQATVLYDRQGARQYRLVRKIGAGGFGEVYLAVACCPSGLEHQVAIKMLLETRADRSALKRLHDEAMLLASLRHPAILIAHDLIVLSGRIALVTEYVEGWDLRTCLDEPTDSIPFSAVLGAVGQVADALHAAWSGRQIVHRDIKPSNIRIGRHGNVKLLDFGIAKSLRADLSEQSQTNTVLGSLYYLSPERFDRDRPPHPASDVFALGCILAEGLTGRRLFNFPDPLEILRLLQDPGALRAHVEGRLEAAEAHPARALISEMLTADPDQRIDARAVAQRIELLTDDSRRDSLRTWCRGRRSTPSPEGRPGASTPLEEHPFPPLPDEVDESSIPAWFTLDISPASLVRAVPPPQQAPPRALQEIDPVSLVQRDPSPKLVSRPFAASRAKRSLAVRALAVFGATSLLLAVAGVLGVGVLGTAGVVMLAAISGNTSHGTPAEELVLPPIVP